jgi:hypothetical protein
MRRAATRCWTPIRSKITDGAGTTVTFEYDTGYYFDIPQSLAIQVPRTGVTDGQRFQIRDASDPLNAPVTFEIDFNNFWLPGNQRVAVQPGASADDVAQAIVNAIDLLDGVLDGNFGLGLNPKVTGDGLVHLGAPQTITANADLSNLTIPPTILTLAIPAIVSGPGVVPNVADGQRFSVALDHDNNPLTPPIVQTFEFDTNNFWNSREQPHQHRQRFHGGRGGRGGRAGLGQLDAEPDRDAVRRQRAGLCQ